MANPKCKTKRVKVRVSFTGYLDIQTNNLWEAQKIARKDFNGIFDHGCSNREQIKNWNIDIHSSRTTVIVNP